MKFIAVVIAALASAVAADYECEPGTYSCTQSEKYGHDGWKVCDVSHKWVHGGDCPPKTVCKFDHENDSPYCVPHGFHFP
ncbi:hypothetical protein CDD83_5950 [Cordyceps sp. RAO-2017]|nr:hypothetical protein CDD83_5950 [Cordyceps sp. RAO-2017]